MSTRSLVSEKSKWISHHNWVKQIVAGYLPFRIPFSLLHHTTKFKTYKTACFSALVLGVLTGILIGHFGIESSSDAAENKTLEILEKQSMMKPTRQILQARHQYRKTQRQVTLGIQ